jgi:hypothetical protein
VVDRLDRGLRPSRRPPVPAQGPAMRRTHAASGEARPSAWAPEERKDTRR